MIECVRRLANRRGVAPSHIALAWLLHQPAVTAPILGTTKVAHVEAALVACEVMLEEGELAELRDVYCPHRPDADTIAQGGETR